MRIVLASYLVRGASTTVAMVSLLCSPRDCGHRTPSGISAHSGDTTVCINIQGTPAIVPWMPIMTGTLATW